MPVGEESDEQVLHQLLLPDDDLAHLKGQHVHESALLLDAVIQFFDVNTFHLMCFFIFSRINNSLFHALQDHPFL